MNNVNKWMFFEFVQLNNRQNLQNGEILQKIIKIDVIS